VPTHDQLDAAVGAWLAWCASHEPDGVVLVGERRHAPEWREGFILQPAHAIPVLAIAPRTLELADVTSAAHPQWNDEGALTLKLTESKLVHGTELENSWLMRGRIHALRVFGFEGSPSVTLIPAHRLRGRLAWRAVPAIPDLLGAIGQSSRDLPVTLRVLPLGPPVGRTGMADWQGI
jgi:hypothetical protein